MIAAGVRGGRKRQRGQSVVEFAIALPVMLWLLSGLFDLGRVSYYEITVADAARNAARVLASNDAGSGPGAAAGCAAAQEAAVNASAAPVCPSSGVQPAGGQVLVVISCPDSNNACVGDPTGTVHGQPVTVDVYYGFRLLTPLVSSMAPGGVIPIHAQVVMNAAW
jgi:Flp pilus assembly protein TadG